MARAAKHVVAIWPDCYVAALLAMTVEARGTCVISIREVKRPNRGATTCAPLRSRRAQRSRPTAIWCLLSDLS